MKNEKKGDGLGQAEDTRKFVPSGGGVGKEEGGE